MLSIGEMIRHRREELHISQSELAAGICSNVTISRLETGVTEPSRSVYEALMERLGMPSTRYHTFVSSAELEAYNLRYDLIASMSISDYTEVERLVGQLEKLITPADKSYYQFTLYTRAQIAGRHKGAKAKLQLLDKALAVTGPPFYNVDPSRLLLTLTEIRIFNNIAACQHDLGSTDKALVIIDKLIPYLETRFTDPLDMISMLTALYSKAAKYKGLLERYEDARQDAERGIFLCKKYGKLTVLPNLLFNAGYVRYQLYSEDPKAHELLHQAYVVFKIMEDKRNIAVAENFFKDNNIPFTFY